MIPVGCFLQRSQIRIIDWQNSFEHLVNMFLIKRYIAKEFLAYFLICTLSLIAIAVMFSALAELSHLEEEGGTKLFFEALLSGIPLLIEVITPITVLLATVLTFISLSKSSEIIAMMAAGTSLLHLVIPVLICVCFVSGFLYYNQSYLAPLWGADKRAGLVRSVNKNDLWRFHKNTLYQFKSLDRRKRKVNSAVYYHFNDNYVIDQTGEFNSLSLNRDSWSFSNRRDIEVDKSNIIQRRQKEDSLPEKQLPVVFSNELVNPKYADIVTLTSEINIKKEGAVNYRNELFALYQKISGLISVFVMVLLALPFSIYSGRSANVRTGIVVSVILGFVFWLVDQLLVSLSDAGTFPIIFSAFGANIVFITFGFILIRLKRS